VNSGYITYFNFKIVNELDGNLGYIQYIGTSNQTFALSRNNLYFIDHNSQMSGYGVCPNKKFLDGDDKCSDCNSLC
jgi:hypothetical protein